MLIDQLSIFIENRPGSLAEITQVLADGGIDIRALSLADTTSFGILRIIAARPELAAELLREAGYTVSATKVVAVEVADEPGGLCGVMKVLAEAQINVEYAYAFIAHGVGNTFVILRSERAEDAAQALQAGGVRVIGKDELFKV